MIKIKANKCQFYQTVIALWDVFFSNFLNTGRRVEEGVYILSSNHRLWICINLKYLAFPKYLKWAEWPGKLVIDVKTRENKLWCIAIPLAMKYMLKNAERWNICSRVLSERTLDFPNVWRSARGLGLFSSTSPNIFFLSNRGNYSFHTNFFILIRKGVSSNLGYDSFAKKSQIGTRD